MNIERLKAVILRYEGLRLKPYCDKTGKEYKSGKECGKLTIGVGRNLEDKGITIDEAMYMLENDIAEIYMELEKNPIFVNLDNIRQEVLMNMAFNIGINGLMKFKNMWKVLENKNYKKAAEEMLNSRWAKQVGNRAKELAYTMENGKYPFEVPETKDKVLEYLNKMFKEINEGW